MSCSLSIAEICQIIDLKLAGLSDTHLTQVIPAADCVYNAVLSNGVIIPFEVRADNVCALDAEGNPTTVQACLDDLKARVAVLEADPDDDTTYVFGPITTTDDPTICTITVTGLNGGEEVSSQIITIPHPTPESDGVHVTGISSFNPNTGVVIFSTVNDLDESPAGNISLNLGALISDPFTITGGGDVTVTFDAATGEYVVTAVDTDTASTLVENPDGSFTWTSADGNTTETIPAPEPVPVLLDKAGSPINGPITPVTMEDTGPTGPVVSVRCVEGAVERTYCNGDTQCSNATLNAVRGLANGSTTIDPATPAGPIASKLICYSVTLPKCGGRLQTHTHAGYLPSPDPTFPFTPGALQTIQVTEQISYDGGATFTGFNVTGGTDAIGLGAGGGGTAPRGSVAEGSEHTFHAVTLSGIFSGVVDVCVRAIINNNALSPGSGSINMGAFNAQSYFTEERCC